MASMIDTAPLHMKLTPWGRRIHNKSETNKLNNYRYIIIAL